MRKYPQPSLRLVLVCLCNQLSGYFQKANLTVVVQREWTMPVAQLPCPHPAQPLLVSLQAINSAQSHSSSSSKMPLDGIGILEHSGKKIAYILKGVYFSALENVSNKRHWVCGIIKKYFAASYDLDGIKMLLQYNICLKWAVIYLCSALILMCCGELCWNECGYHQ